MKAEPPVIDDAHPSATSESIETDVLRETAPER